MPKLGTESTANLADVHENLIRLTQFIITFFDFKITDGLRTAKEQAENVRKGVSKTMASKHLRQADGKAHAVDIEPFPQISWQAVEASLAAVKKLDPKLDLLRFYYMQGVVRGVAEAKGIAIRQGIDWNGNNDLSDQSFFDLPHVELK